jgi:hypothetical protein
VLVGAPAAALVLVGAAAGWVVVVASAPQADMSGNSSMSITIRAILGFIFPASLLINTL